MPLGITAAYNSDTDSPGVDLTVTGALSYSVLNIERIDNTGTYPNVKVRGFDDRSNVADTIVGEDLEAPIGLSLKYRVVASDFDPQITAAPSGAQSASGIISASIPPPTGSVTDDLNILQVVMKPYTSTMSTPSGWTLIGSKTSGTTASGPDTGSVVIYSFYRTGQLTSNTSIAGTGSNVILGRINRFHKSVSNAWSVTAVSGADQVAGSGHSSTATATITPQATDLIYAFAGINTDNTSDVTERGLSLPNSTLTSPQSLGAHIAIDGDDAAIHGVFAKVAASTGAGAPTMTITATSTLFGASFFIKISVTGSTSETVESSSLTIPYTRTGQAWLKSVFVPSISKEVHVNAYPSWKYETRILGKYNVLGRIYPVIITDDWGSRTGSFKLVTGHSDFGAFKALKDLVTTGGTLMFQTTGDHVGPYPDMYFEVESYSVERVDPLVSGQESMFIHDIQFTEVDRPDTSDSALGLRTYQDVLDAFANYTAVDAAYATYLDLLNG